MKYSFAPFFRSLDFDNNKKMNRKVIDGKRKYKSLHSRQGTDKPSINQASPITHSSAIFHLVFLFLLRTFFLCLFSFTQNPRHFHEQHFFSDVVRLYKLLLRGYSQLIITDDMFYLSSHFWTRKKDTQWT